MTDVERIAVLESKVADLQHEVKELRQTLEHLANNCPDINDVQRRFQTIHKAFVQLCSTYNVPHENKDLFERIFGI